MTYEIIFVRYSNNIGYYAMAHKLGAQENRMVMQHEFDEFFVTDNPFKDDPLDDFIWPSDKAKEIVKGVLAGMATIPEYYKTLPDYYQKKYLSAKEAQSYEEKECNGTDGKDDDRRSEDLRGCTSEQQDKGSERSEAGDNDGAICDQKVSDGAIPRDERGTGSRPKPSARGRRNNKGKQSLGKLQCSTDGDKQ